MGRVSELGGFLPHFIGIVLLGVIKHFLDNTLGVVVFEKSVCIGEKIALKREANVLRIFDVCENPVFRKVVALCRGNEIRRRANPVILHKPRNFNERISFGNCHRSGVTVRGVLFIARFLRGGCVGIICCGCAVVGLFLASPEQQHKHETHNNRYGFFS